MTERAFFAAGDSVVLYSKNLLTSFFIAPLSFGVCCCQAGQERGLGRLVFGKGNFLPVGPQGALIVVTHSLPVTRS